MYILLLLLFLSLLVHVIHIYSYLLLLFVAAIMRILLEHVVFNWEHALAYPQPQFSHIDGGPAKASHG